MSEFSKSLSISASGLTAQAERLHHLAENISNADTPGYRRKLVSFQTAFGSDDGAARVEVGRVSLDHKTEPERVFDPSHPLADGAGYYEGSNVDLMIELADAREAQRSYEANLKMFENARKMMSGLNDLLRR